MNNMVLQQQQQQYPYVYQPSSYLYSYPTATYTATTVNSGLYLTPRTTYQYPSGIAAQVPYQHQTTEYSPGNHVEGSSPEASIILNVNEGQTIKEPCKIKSHNKQNSLPSSEINKQSLCSVEEMLKETFTYVQNPVLILYARN